MKLGNEVDLGALFKSAVIKTQDDKFGYGKNKTL